ncbi:MAG: cbb3-type cytochrome c oxidase N-terminal domain-containing protein [Crocinitomicaceae bacterium]
MERLKSIKSSLLLAIALVYSSLSKAQDSGVAPKIDRPIYEDLGISSTSLFTIMILFTVLLVLALIAIINSTKNIYGFSKSRNSTKIGLVLMGTGASTASYAQDAHTTDALISFPDSAFWAFMILDIIIIMLILYFVGLMRGSLSKYAPAKKPKTIFSRWNKVLTNAVEIEDEGSILLDHDYDGIKELDNDLPPWWKYGFYITIVWAVIYFGVYQVFKIAPTQNEEYLAELIEGQQEVAAYKAANPNLVTEETAKLLTDPGDLAKGKKVYETNCVACHMANGGGGIGPNLTDANWIYGGDIKGVFHTVSEGAKNGMAAWKDLLGADKIEAVSSYVLSLPLAEGGKEAQGENIFE